MSVAFPAGYYLTKRTEFDIDLGVENDQLDNGTLQQRVLSEDVYSTIACTLPVLTRNEVDTLTAFLQTNRTEDITMTVDGVNYIGKIVSNLRKSMIGNRFNIEFDYRAREA